MNCERPSLFLAFAAAVLASALAACQPESSRGGEIGEGGDDGVGAGRVTVAVAASMRFAFEDIVAAFREREAGIEIEASYGSSGGFYAQLLQRAPYDLFLSGDMVYPDQLASGGHAGASFPYAVGRLALWAPESEGLDVAGRGMEVLRDTRVKKIAIAHPEVAPYGRAAIDAMRHYGVEIERGTAMLWGENVAQAAQFVQSGGAQVGLIAYSLTKIPEVGGAGDVWLVPLEAHEPLEHGGVILGWCRDRAAAGAFREFLLGAEAGEILGRHGFSPPN